MRDEGEEVGCARALAAPLPCRPPFPPPSPPDRRINVYNTHTGARTHSVDTGAQVCGLAWSPVERELLSSHGYSAAPGAPSNSMCLWKYPSMTKAAQVGGHAARVLHLAVSPAGDAVATAAADETLRLWRVFGAEPAPAAAKKAAVGGARRAGGALAAVTVR